MASPDSIPFAPPPDWFGQPRGLTILFLTEMWDQFSFFGMRALLVLYMTKHLSLAQAEASWIYGIYAATVYLTPLFGGMITDRWLTRRTAVQLGGGIMAVGHFMMASEHLLLPALATIALGNGLFLPSLPSQIDSLYARDDPRRKSAYNVYYVGINIGAFFAPIVVGTVGEIYGFHWGFSIAGAGMIIAMLTYTAGRRYLPPEPPRRLIRLTSAPGEPRQVIQPTPRPDPNRPAHTEHNGASEPSANHVPGSTSPPGDSLLARALVLLSIMGAVIVFRGAYEQLGNTISLWADQAVDRRLTAGLTIPVTWFQSLNPLLVFALTPYLVARWTRLAVHGREPSSLHKMASGATIVALSYLVLAGVSTWVKHHDGLVSWPWMVVFIVIMTTGELYILPVGLGLFGRLAPAGLKATAIATWFFAGFLGNLLAGWLGTTWGNLTHRSFFVLIGTVALAAAGLLALLIPRVGRLELGVTHPPEGRTQH
jgi:proton-dependent oligopeptide transporter, POT family